MALSPSRGNIFAGSVSEWAIKDSDRPDVGYSVIPFIRAGELTITSIQSNDAQMRPVPFGYDVKCVAQFPGVKTKANMISLLAALGTKTIDHRITTIGGQVLSSKPTVNPLSPTGLGVAWKLISNADMDKDMYVELTATRFLTPTEYTNALTSANKDTTAADAADTFYALNSLTRADIIPAGISKIELGVADAGTYLDAMTNIRKATFTAELLTQKNSRQMDIGFAVKIDFTVEGMETAEPELLKWQGIANRLNESKITFVGGLVCAMPHTLGITTEVSVKSDMSDIGMITVKGSGAIVPSAFAGLWS